MQASIIWKAEKTEVRGEEERRETDRGKEKKRREERGGKIRENR